MGLGDMHLPWHSVEAMAVVYRDIKKYQPDVIIQMGDLYDMLSYTRFARSQNIMTPRQEIDSARELAVKGWKKIKNLAPKAKLFQIMGNHDWRPMKRILDLAPEFEHLVTDRVRELFVFEGVETIFDPREDLVIDGIACTHGHKSKLGDHMMESHENIMCAHSHRGGTVSHPWNGCIKTELNCGWLGDRHSPAAAYTARKRFSRWTEGYGWWDERGPRFVPIYLRKKNQ